MILFGRSVGSIYALHARHDGLIDASHAERMHGWAGGPKRLVLFERGDHNTVFSVNRAN